MNSDISDKDKIDWESFLSKKETLHDKDLKISETNKLRVKLCDLHGYSLDEANEKVRNFLIVFLFSICFGSKYKTNKKTNYTP